MTMTPEDELASFEAQAEEAYSQMYDARHRADITACYSNAKEALRYAIALARRLHRPDEAKRLEARLAHIKGVFRSQFAQLT
jgi:hypothetical protein